jgi:quercetin dioxygenase-like cupin family protein
VADYTAKRIDQMERLHRGAMRKVRAELGLTSFGVQTIDLPPNSDRHPWHDHSSDGQEELYLALRGSGTLEIEGAEPVQLTPGETLARVGPSARRRVVAGPDGIRLLIVGGVPGNAFTPTDFTQLGAPDPQRASDPGHIRSV